MPEGQNGVASDDSRSHAKELRDNRNTGADDKPWLKSDEGRKTARKLGMNDATFDKCREVFFNADTDQSGSINMSEMRELLDHVLQEKLTDEEFEATCNKFDANHDGVLNFDEFLEVLADTKVYQNEHLSEMIDIMSEELRKEMQDARLSPDETLKIHGVDKAHVLLYVRSEVAQMKACLQLPMAMGILIAYACAIIMHARIEVLHAVDKAVAWDIYENANFAFAGNVPFENGRMGHKSIEDVNTYADFWSWLNMGLVPIFWRAPTPAEWEFNEVRSNIGEKCKSQQQFLEEYGWSSTSRATASALMNLTFPGVCPEGQEDLQFPHGWFGYPPTPTYKLYYSSVAGMRMRQERTAAQTCLGEEKERRYDTALHTGQCVRDRGYWLKPEIRQSFFSDEDRMNLSEGPNVYLLSGWSQTKVRQELRQLENQAWFDPLTAKVELLYTLYNAHMDTLSAVYINFFVNRGGHFHRMVQPVTFWLNPYHDWRNYVADSVWVLLVGKIALEEVLEMRSIARVHGWRQMPHVYLAISNSIDWANILIVIGIMVEWYFHLNQLGRLHETLELADISEVGSFPTAELRQDYFAQIDQIVRAGEIRRFLLALYPFILVSRLFKAFAAQPRLSLVTRTGASVSTDLVHFGLVFFSVFGLFTMSAMILFGQDLADFSNFNRAADSMFHILIGDFSWEEMKEVGRLPASIWFWTFMILMSQVMLNMLLAVVMDAYTEVRGAIGSHAETLWSQASEIWRRYRELKAGKRISLDYVLSCIDPTTGSRYKHGGEKLDNFNVATFMSAVPGLGEKQAHRILIESLIVKEDELLVAQSMAEGMLDVQRIDRRVSNIHGSVQNVIRMCELNCKLVQQLHEKSEKANSFEISSLPGPSTTNCDDQAPDQNVDDQVLGQKVEEKLRVSTWEKWDKPPPWFENFAGSFLQRFDKLEARVDNLTKDFANPGARRPLPSGMPETLVPGAFQKGAKPSAQSTEPAGAGSLRDVGNDRDARSSLQWDLTPICS